MQLLLVSILIFIALYTYANYLLIKKEDIRRDKFEGKFYNIIYALSYTFPLNKLLNEKRELNKREAKIKEKIKTLDLGYFFNLRSFMALKFILLLAPAVIIIMVMAIISYYNSTFSLMNNLNYFLIPLILAYIPDLYLIKKEMDFQKFNFDEVVILQLFMVLLIKSNSTTEDILYAFSRMETYHKRTFEKAYRMSLRSKSEALEYLGMVFSGTVFGNSFKTLDDMYKYSKEDSLRILQANFKTIEKDSIRDKTKKELTKFSYSQISVIIPFSIVVFLGAIPLIQYGIDLISSSLIGL